MKINRSQLYKYPIFMVLRMIIILVYHSKGLHI
nr:MAG TPA: hypothetical protein [Caudoviricetes sp.]